MSEETKDTAQTSEQVEETAVDEVSTEQVADTTKTAESEPQSTPGAKEQKRVQSKEENSEFARARREREQAKAIDKARAEAQVKAAEEERVKNVIEFVGTNPYTNKPITNTDEVNQYLRMRRIEKNGGDPMVDYADELDREQKAKQKAEQEAVEEQERIQSDVNDFLKTHPDVNLTTLLKDDMLFQALLSAKGEKSLNAVYKDYTSIKSQIEKDAEIKAAAAVAKKESGAGSAKSSGNPPPEVTKAQFKKMSMDERTRLFNDNRALYESLSK